MSAWVYVLPNSYSLLGFLEGFELKSIEISGEASIDLNQSFFWMIALIYYSYSFKTKGGVIVICPHCYITHVRLAQVYRYKPLIIIFIVEMLWIKK